MTWHVLLVSFVLTCISWLMSISVQAHFLTDAPFECWEERSHDFLGKDVSERVEVLE